MATITIPNFLTQKAVTGLNSYQYTVVNSGVHHCRMEIDHHNASALTATISQSGSASSTLATVTLTAGNEQNPTVQGTYILIGSANFVANDVITFALSSSAADDQMPNNVKARLLAYQGPIA